VYKDYVKKYRGLEVPMIQPEPAESTQGTHRTPRATRTPNPTNKPSITIPPSSDDRERDEIHEATLLSLAIHKTANTTEEQEKMDVFEEKISEDDVEKIVEGKDEESYASEFADTVLLDEEDFGSRTEPGSHKEKP
nr:hypothetical protein [Tanacetum cinerariifolium]